MPAKMIIVPGAIELKPYRQGDASSLCGLYSTLNAIQLLLYPDVRLTRKQLQQLVVEGIEFLDTAISIATVFRGGMDERTWMRLGRRLIDHSNAMTGIRIRRTFPLRKVSSAHAVKALNVIRCGLRKGRPMLVSLFGGYDHYTVIVGYTQTRFILFDSSGFRWVSATSVGMVHECSTSLHRIGAFSAMALSRKDRERWPQCPTGDLFDDRPDFLPP